MFLRFLLQIGQIDNVFLPLILTQHLKTTMIGVNRWRARASINTTRTTLVGNLYKMLSPTRWRVAYISLKQQARDLMSDRGMAAQLDIDEPIMDFDYYNTKNEGDYSKIMKGGTTPNADVNKQFGVE